MKRKVIELEIIDEMEESGVSAISLVDSPAINVEWMAFRKEEFVKPRGDESEDEFVSRCIGVLVGDEGYETDQAAAICYSTWRENMSIDTSNLPPYVDELPKKRKFISYTDYPEAAKNAAKRALDFADKNGWGDCGTPIGKQRANQLAKGEPITEETIARMAAFERHRQNSDTPYTEGCGKLMWDAWGGDSGIAWAQRKLREIRKEEFAENIRVGDAVSWTTGGQNPRGKIREIVREGSQKVPGADFEITGTPDNPGYLIEIYEEVDGKWEPTGKLVGRKGDSILKNVQLNAQYTQNSDSYREDEKTGRTKSSSSVSGPTKSSRYFSTNPVGTKTRFFLEEDQRIIVGPAMIPGLEIVRQDEDSKEIYYVKFSENTVAKIAEKFMRELRNKDTNILHQQDLPADSYLMESWIVETEDDKANTKYGFEVPIGTWMVKMRVTNPKVWDLVKSGKLRGLSIEGSFIDKEEIQDIERAKILDKIIRILSEED